MIKKIAALFAAMLLVVGVTPAQAEVKESIAIIDANFEASLISGDVIEVCVVDAALCARDDKPANTRQYQSYNHGTIMADVVRQNNPNATIILVRAANIKTSVVNGIGFAAALDWIQENKSKHNITKVSFSYNAGNGSRCLPSTPGVDVLKAHQNILGDIANLKSMGTTVYAASGNYSSGDRIDYPACITDVVAVGSTVYKGSQAQSDVVVSGFTYTSNSLKSEYASFQDRYQLLSAGKYPVRVGNTTSVATAITAATAQSSVAVVAAPAPEPVAPKPDPRKELGTSLDNSVSLIQALSSNVKSNGSLDKVASAKLVAELKELIAEIEFIYNN